MPNIKTRIKIYLITRTPNWTALAKMQRFKIVKTMYIWLFIVPVAARMLEKVGDVARVTIWDYSFELQIGLPFSWKMFYLSSVCFVLANLISHFRCYKLIRDHVNYSDFIQAGKGMGQLEEYANEYNVSHEFRREFLPSVVRERLSMNEFSTKEEKIKFNYWNLVKCMDSHRENWRLCCFLLYLAGFVLLSVVFFQNFQYVAMVLF